ncbi:MAG: pseudouridine synthase [Burkholderiaceae bacterium]
MSSDTPDVTPDNAPEGTTPAVKKPRAPRKTAVKAEAASEVAAQTPVADVAEAAPAAPRKRARKVAEPVEAAPVDAAPAPVAEALPVAVEAREPRAPRVRAERRPAPVAAEEAAPQAAEPAQVAARGDDAGSGEDGESGEGGDGTGPQADGEGGEGRRSRSRRRRRGRRGGSDDVSADAGPPAEGDEPAEVEPGEEGAERPPRGERPPRPERAPRPVVEFASADVSDTFAGVLSGDFDSDAEIVEGVNAIPAKRVLAAEPDAPKLHKVLAQSGIGSRRDMEQLITDGKVTVNGEVAHTGQRISFGDEVRVAGRVVKLRIAPPPARVIAYHKPAGEVVTMDDPENRPTVFRRLPRLSHGKWQSVGRLDINTEGLLLFTNSGDLANKLMHPRFGVEREYAVRVLGTLEMEPREKLLAGVMIDGQAAHFKSIEDGGGEGANRWYRVVITEGRNREVRKLFDAVGMAVSRLIRIRYGSVVLPKGLRRSVWVDLDDNDVRRLRQLAGADNPQRNQQRDQQRDDGPRDNAPRDGAPRDNGPRDGAPRENAPREGAPRDGAPREGGQRNNQQPRNERGPRADNGPRANNSGGGQQPKQQRDRGDRNTRGRDRDRPARQEQASSPAPFREPGDPSFIPNPLQQTFDRRAIQQRDPRPVAVDYDDGTDGPIGPIPNPLQQTYDKRGVSGKANPFAKNGKRGGGGGGGGFGAGGSGSGGGGGGGGGGQPKQPDPMQTAVGYIGADTFIKKLNNRGGGGGRGRR